MAFVEKKRWVFFGLPLTFTKYTVDDERLIINRGFLKTIEDDCYIYKILDVKLEKTVWERIFGLGSVVCYTGDVSDKVIKLEHIKHAKEIKDFIFEQSEAMRRKRRTLNTLNLSQGLDDIDIDDDVDN